ncbi:Rib/alpha-like domain-containing protein [Microbacterium sp. Root180]|uniref:Rib/alpha-like domain-containing protein n=1 Tax=Microbacterium sp. Root180 TaxID=1736483 RepID=UPI000A95D15F|nr:Rib/alpha-like domain-containing protein [Microbacterium sp. Root180]
MTRTRMGRSIRGAAAVAVAVVLAATGVASANAVAGDAYLQDYSAGNGQIQQDNGNTSGLDATQCGFSWSAQSVIDTDLPNYSVNGFLEGVAPLADTSLPGSGWAQIQHWHTPDGQVLNWRIPVAVDRPLLDATVTMVFDDPDWSPNQSSFQQFSTWPGFPSSFQRFTGISGYTAHDDTQVTPFQWGDDGAGHTTLTFDLGDLQASTSTVLAFTGVPADGPAGVLGGTSYGAKFVLDGTQPLATCLNPSYDEATALTGDVVQLPVAVTAVNGDVTAAPSGTTYALAAGAPAGATIDPVDGEISWTIPGSQPVGDVSVPVTVTYPDGSVDTTAAMVRVGKEPRLGPFDDQTITLGDSIEHVDPVLRDHLGQPYGDGSSLSVTGLPDGVTFDAATGRISGTPTASGVFPVTVTGLDAGGETLISADFTITVTAVTPTPTPTPSPTQPTPEPTTSPTAPVLANTGGTAPGPALLTGVVALAAGGAILGWSHLRRRRV